VAAWRSFSGRRFGGDRERAVALGIRIVSDRGRMVLCGQCVLSNRATIDDLAMIDQKAEERSYYM
jgi:hypothetical protein